MTKERLLALLKHWLICESCVDRDGNISPSKMSIDIAHHWFITNNKYTRFIESARLDQQGGILLDIHMVNQNYKFIIHVLFDGVVDYYQIHKNGYVDKQRMFPNKNLEQGFGTSKYQF